MGVGVEVAKEEAEEEKKMKILSKEVKAIRDEKKKTALEIYKAITNFEGLTGLTVNGILLGRLDKNKDKLTHIMLEVKL